MESAFRRQIRTLRDAGLRDLYVFGSAGEGYAVDSARFREVAAVFLDEARGETVQTQIGVIALSTANSIERITIAYDLGCRFFQISLPSWHELNDRELLTFFIDVCGSFPDAKFLHYDLDRVRRRLSAADYRRIVDRVPNLVAAKITGQNVEAAKAVISQVPEIQPFFTELLFAKVCSSGRCSLLAASASLCPRRAIQYFQMGMDRRWDDLERLANEYSRLRLAVFESLGRGRIDGIYDKVLARLGGHDIPLRLLSPYEGISEQTFEACRTAFQKEFAGWIIPTTGSNTLVKA